MEDGLKRN